MAIFLLKSPGFNVFFLILSTFSSFHNNLVDADSLLDKAFAFQKRDIVFHKFSGVASYFEGVAALP